MAGALHPWVQCNKHLGLPDHNHRGTGLAKGVVKMAENSKFDFGTIMILIFVAMILLQIIASVLGNYYEPLKNVKLGQGFLLMAVGVAVLATFAIVFRKFKGEDYTRNDITILILITAGVIALIYFLPKVTPSVFSVAREQLIINIQSMMGSP